jgi:TrkA domain protein
MTRIERVGLPGIGTGYKLHTRGGRLLGVVCRRDGAREIVLYTPGDPDTAERSLTLTRHEAQHVAELLHATTTIDHLAGLDVGMRGVTAAGISIHPSSPSVGRTLGEAVPDDLGVRIIAITRGLDTIVAPGPACTLAAGDVLAAAGTRDDIDRLASRLGASAPVGDHTDGISRLE